MGTLLHVVHSPARGGPAGSDVLLAWVPHAGGLGGAHRVGEGGAYLFDFMHSFAIEFLHWKEEKVELRARRREAMGNADSCAPSHVSSWLGHGFGCWMMGWKLGGCDVAHPREAGVRVQGGEGCGGQASGGSVGSSLSQAWMTHAASRHLQSSGRCHRAHSRGCGAPGGRYRFQE